LRSVGSPATAIRCGRSTILVCLSGPPTATRAFSSSTSEIGGRAVALYSGILNPARRNRAAAVIPPEVNREHRGQYVRSNQMTGRHGAQPVPDPFHEPAGGSHFPGDGIAYMRSRPASTRAGNAAHTPGTRTTADQHRASARPKLSRCEFHRRSKYRVSVWPTGRLPARPKIVHARDFEPPVDRDDQRSSRRRTKRSSIASRHGAASGWRAWSARPRSLGWVDHATRLTPGAAARR
jgi:hypothetical protein